MRAGGAGNHVMQPSVARVSRHPASAAEASDRSTLTPVLVVVLVLVVLQGQHHL